MSAGFAGRGTPPVSHGARGGTPPVSHGARGGTPPASGGRALRFEDVRIRRGRREVLHVAELGVEDGETLAILGPNGSGKSTLLLTAALLLPVAAGTVSLFGEAALGRGHVGLRRQTSTVFQEPALLDMSVRRNLETALALHDVPRSERRARSEAWLGRLGVAHLGEAMPHTLSGGEARRVSLARAFAVRPRLLFLDEPFSALDLETRAELVGDLRALLRDEGTTALLVTHDHSEAQLLADRSLVLLDGEPAQLDRTQTLFAAPASPEVAAFLGYSVVQTAGLPAELEISDPRIVAIRPTAVRLTEDRATGHEAEVTAVQGAHGQGRLLLAVGDETVAASMPVERIRALELRPGATVRFEIDRGGIVGWGGGE